MISVSRMRELVEEQEEQEKKIKAYIVSDKWLEYSVVVFAETSGKAKSDALYYDEFSNTDSEYIDLRAKRMKEWDKYSETKKIPIAEMLKNGWWFYCDGYCGRQLSEDDIISGDAVIIEDERNDFVKGNVICKECLKKKRG